MSPLNLPPEGTEEAINLTPEVVTGRNGNQLTPFTNTPEGRKRASEAGKKGAETKKAMSLARKLEDAALKQQLHELRETYRREDLGPTAAALAQEIMRRTLNGSIQIRNGAEAADILRQLVDIARLESGEATSHTAHLSMTADQALETIRNAQNRAE